MRPKAVCRFVFAALLLLLGLPTAQGQGARTRENAAGETEQAERDHVRQRAEWFREGRRVRGESAAALRYRAYLQKRKLAAKRRAAILAAQRGAAEATTSATAAPAPITALASNSWTNLGPAPIDSDWLKDTFNEGFQDYGFVSGRVTSVTVDQSDPTGNTVYVGGAYGGVWKSTNAAAAVPANVVWTQLFDDQPTLAIGAIAVSPDGQTVLVGTGEPNNSGDSYYGVGILRSTDAGASWSLIGTANNAGISFKGVGFSKIAFNTADPTKVVAASAAVGVTRGLFNFLPGAYFSSDGGASWTLATFSDSGNGFQVASVTDVAYNAADNSFYAALQSHGIYRSTDNGQTWTRLFAQPGGALLSASACPTSVPNTCPMFRGQIAIRPGSNEMFVLIVDQDDNNRGIFRSVNSGGTWTSLNITGIGNCGDGAANGCGTLQGTYNLYLAAVPNGTGTDLYAGAVNLFKCSIPAGTSTTGMCGAATTSATSGSNRWLNLTHVYGCSPTGRLAHVHPDQHGIDFSRTQPNIIYFGNDGGVYRSLTASTGLATGICTGTNAFQNLNGTIGSMSEFVSFAQHSTDDGILLGGLQDNGSPAIDRTSLPGSTFWQAVNGGDGGYSEIDSSNPNIWYVENFDVSIQRCTLGTSCRGSSFPVIIDNAAVGGDGGLFYTPYILDPQMTGRILVATCRVWRGNADGSGMTALSDKLNDGTTGVCGSIFDSTRESSYVNALAAGGPTTSNGSQVIYAGLTNGHIFVTTSADSGAASFVDTTANGLTGPRFRISSIALDPTVASGQTAYIAVQGFGTPHLYRTTNAGASWTNVSGDLPDAPADSVLVDPIDPKIVYVGTDVGIFVTTDVTAGSVQWNLYGPDSGAGAIPNVPVTRLLAFNVGGKRKLRASTYGRGVWEIDLLGGSDDFTLAVADDIVPIRKGGTATFGLTATRSGTFAAPVTLSCVPDPPATGATCSLAPNPADLAATASVPVTLDVATLNSIAFGDYPFVLHGAGGGKTHDLNLVLRVNDFTVASGTPPQTLEQTGTASYSITLTPQGTFDEGVVLSCANFTTAGLSCTFPTPNSIVPGGPASTVTLHAAADAAVGAGTFDIVATGDGASHSVSVGYTVTLVQDFSFVADSALTQSVTPGAATGWATHLLPLNDFAATVNTSCVIAGAPAGAVCSATPDSVAIGSQTSQPVTIAISTTSATPTGNYAVTVTATGGGKTHTLGLTLAVQGATLVISPATRTIPPGAGTTYTITSASLNGFTTPLMLGCVSPPAGVTCSFVPPTITPGAGSSTLNVLTTASITAGAKTLAIAGALLGVPPVVQSNASLSISSTTPTFTITNSTATKMLPVGGSTTFSLSVRSNTTTSPGALTMSCAPPLPPGVACSFNPATFTPTTTARVVTATVTTTAGTPVSSHTLVFRAASFSHFKQVNGTLQVQDFTLDATPDSQIIAVPGGGTATYTVVLTGVNGFATPVTLSCTGLPVGASCGFAPASLAPTGAGATSTLTVTTTASTPFGPSSFTVQGTGGTLTRSETVEVVNGTNDYAFATGTAFASVRPGQTADYSISIARYGTFSALVDLSCAPDPPATGAACSITPDPADLTTGSGTTAALALSTDAATTPIGDYSFNFHGDGGGKQHDLALTLHVNDFTVASSTPQQTIEQTGTATYTVNVTGQNNFTDTVALSCANFTSAGLSCTFAPNNFVPGNSLTPVTVTLHAAAGAAVGAGTFDVVATGGGASHSVNRGYNVILVQDFTYATSTGTQTILAGQSALYSTTLTPLNSFGASIALTCSGLPAGATCAFDPVSPVVIGSATPAPVGVTAQTASNTPAGNYTVTATATGGGKTHSVALALAVQSFTLSVTPASISIPASGEAGGAIFRVTVNPQNGLTLPVFLSCPGAPAGVFCSPPDSPVAPGATASMLVGAALGTSTGAKTVTIRGMTDFGVPQISQNVTVNISTTAPSFTITTSTPTRIVSQGGSTSFTLSVRATSTASPGALTMSCASFLPPGVTCSFNPATFTPTTTARLVTATVQTSNATPALSWGMVFQAATLTQFKRVNATLQVADYTLAVTPATRTISSASGGSTTFAATLTSVDGFASPVSLSCPGLPAGWTCAFAPVSLTPTAGGAASALTLTTTGSPLGAVNVTVQGSGGGLTRSQQVQVINGEDFALAPVPAALTVQKGGSDATTIGVTALGPFADNVTLSCPSLPDPGLSCGFSVDPVAPGGSSVLTVSATAAVPGGSYVVPVQGVSTSPARTHSFNLTVNVVPDFTLAVTPATQVVVPGGGADYTVDTATTSGFPDSIALGCQVLTAPAGAACSFDSATLNAGSSTIMHVTTTGATPGGAYTVRVTATSGATVHTQDVAMTLGSITVTAPNGGQVLSAGTTTSIQWSFSGVAGTVTIELLKGGVVNRTLTTAASIGTAGTGSFSWAILSTQTMGDDYRIRVRSNTTPSISDTSNADFRINRVGIVVKTPNGGESWAPGSTQTIRWLFSGAVGTAVKIDLFKAGVLNRTIIASTPIGSGGSGQFNFAIPASQTPGSDYRIRVASTSSAMNDLTDSNFTIAP